MSGSAPSDWERGVLDAAKWLKSKGYGVIADGMLRSVKVPDEEGTEARTVRQVVQHMREITDIARSAENQHLLDTDEEYRLDSDARADWVRGLTESIEAGDWRLQ